MKKGLYMLMLMVSVNASLADYSGGRITNYNGTYTGDIRVKDTTLVIPGTHSSALFRDRDGSTTLNGNIVMDGGSLPLTGGYADGVYMGNGKLFGSVTSNVWLSTQAAGQSITITADGGYGLFNQGGAQSKLSITANQEGQLQDVVISSRYSGMYAENNSVIDITGNTLITAGRYRDDVNHSGVHAASNGKIKISGIMEVNGKAYGLIASGTGSNIDLREATYTKVRGENIAIRAHGGGVIQLGSHLDVVDNSTYNPGAMSAIGAGSMISGAGSYLISGKIAADTSGVIDLQLLNGSNFTGYTTVGTSSGNVDLALFDGATWNVSQNASLTNLTLNEGSILNFSVNGSNFSTNNNNSATKVTVYESWVMEDDAVIALDMSSYTGAALKHGSAIKLVYAATYASSPDVKIRFSVKNYDLAEGLEWDWSTFTRDGTIRVRDSRIPEPRVAILSFLGIAALLLQRRRTS